MEGSWNVERNLEGKIRNGERMNLKRGVMGGYLFENLREMEDGTRWTKTDKECNKLSRIGLFVYEFTNPDCLLTSNQHPFSHPVGNQPYDQSIDR